VDGDGSGTGSVGDNLWLVVDNGPELEIDLDRELGMVVGRSKVVTVSLTAEAVPGMNAYVSVG